MNDSTLVKLNVGGTKYMTTLQTLRLRGPNMLSQMVEYDLAGTITTTKDEKGALNVARGSMTPR